MTKFDMNKIMSNQVVGFHTSPAFNCPVCKGFAAHKWRSNFRHRSTTLGFSINGQETEVEIDSFIVESICEACSDSSFWIKNSQEEILIFPLINVDVPIPNPDMPNNIKQIFNEAGLVLNSSPRASAALSRLAIDILTKEVVPDAKNLNYGIGKMVEQGMPVEIQQSLDIVRVIGNNAIHPGEIDISDDKDTAQSLMELLNIIVENRISQPKKIYEIYSKLPQGALKAIEDRDNKN